MDRLIFRLVCFVGNTVTYIVFFFLLSKSMGTSNCLVTHILQNIFFCVQHKKEIHTGLGTVYFHFRHNQLCLYVNLVCFLCAHTSGVRAQKRHMSEQHVNEVLNRQGFKAPANNVLLWLLVNTVSCEWNSTTELTFDVNICHVLQYIETKAPEL